MKLAMLLAATALAAQARIPDYEAARYADAIYRAEGGVRAKAPYGILSVRVSGPDEARRVCIRTIQNTHDRWVAAGKPGYYVHFLADRYCPPSVDPVGNRNWKANVVAFLSRK